MSARRNGSRRPVFHHGNGIDQHTITGTAHILRTVDTFPCQVFQKREKRLKAQSVSIRMTLAD